MYPFLYRHLLSRIEAEAAHHRGLGLLAALGSSRIGREMLRALAGGHPTQPVQAFGLRFAHPLGLAAGFDKDARCLPALQSLGFSFVEVGTVTPQPQPGNPAPRLFRLPQDKALINRLGFPSAGAEAVSAALRRWQAVSDRQMPVFISLGKNKTTPLTHALDDYRAGLETLYGLGDAFVINISSPNTPELRQLQTRAYLTDLLRGMSEQMKRSAASLTPAPSPTGRGESMAADVLPIPKPLLLKIAPDLEWADVDDIAQTALEQGIAGIIATNTTLDRARLRSPQQREAGGLSGAPLRQRSTAIIRHLHQHTEGHLPIIGVGGIFSHADLMDKLEAGAVLAQAYTGFIYRGPRFVHEVLTENKFTSRLCT